jgi:hypothetical protein
MPPPLAPFGELSNSSAQPVAYIDTVGLFVGADRLPDLPPNILSRLREANRNEAFIDDNACYPNGGFIGKRYEVNQPTLDVFNVLDELQAACDATVSRFDIAVDFLRNRHAMKKRLLRQAILKRRSRMCPLMNDHKNTTYWIDTTHRAEAGMKPPRRNLALYSDRPFRLTDDEQPCTHFELRILDPDAVRRELDAAGVGYKPSDILRINPAHHFDRNVSLLNISDDNIERWIQQQPRPHRIRGEIKRFFPDHRAQELHLIYGIKGKLLPLDELGIPASLTVLGGSPNDSILHGRTSTPKSPALYPANADASATPAHRVRHGRLRPTTGANNGVHRVRIDTRIRNRMRGILREA